MTSRQVSKVRDVFDAWARTGRAEGMERGHGPVARQAFDKLSVTAGSRYLDIGCGNGYTLRWAATIDPSVSVVGMDVSSEMVALAREQSATFANLLVHEGAFPSPQLDGTFDAIFSMEVFYYLPDVAQALASVYELLAPGGRFVCVVDFYRENAASHSWPADLGVSMALHSAAEWKAICEAAGFDQVEQSRLFSPDVEADSWQASEGSLLTLCTRL